MEEDPPNQRNPPSSPTVRASVSPKKISKKAPGSSKFSRSVSTAGKNVGDERGSAKAVDVSKVGVPGQAITQELLQGFVIEHEQLVRKIIMENAAATISKIKAQTDTLRSNLGVPASESVDATESADNISSLDAQGTNHADLQRQAYLLKGEHSPGSSFKPALGNGGFPESGAQGKAVQRVKSHRNSDSRRSLVLETPKVLKLPDCANSSLTSLTGCGAVMDTFSSEETADALVSKPSRFTFHALQQGILPDNEVLKRQARDKLDTPEYNVCDLYKSTGWPQLIARNTYFELSSLLVVTVNAFWLAYDIDANDAALLVDSQPVFIFADNFFCIYFTLEWCIRFAAFKIKRDCLSDFWMVFDGILCSTMILETWVLTFAFIVFNASSDLVDTSVLRLLRLAKLVRLGRLARILNSVPELLVIVKGITVASRAVACAFSLLLFVCYTFAIVMRQVSDGTELGKKNYPTVLSSMRYLVTLGTVPDLFDPVEETFDAGSGFAFIFTCFVILVAITVMNMLVGILVQVVDSVATVEKEQMLVTFVRQNLIDELEMLDREQDRSISRVEFDDLLTSRKAMQSFKHLGVDVTALVQMTYTILEQTESIPYDAFFKIVMQLRGCNQATVKDIVDLRHFIVSAVQELHQVLTEEIAVGMATPKRQKSPSISSRSAGSGEMPIKSISEEHIGH